MRWGLLLLIFSGCNSEPLDLPEPSATKISPEALVACGAMTCGRGQACCTHDDGIGGNCYGLDANDRCYSFFACDGAEDCLDGTICCESYGHYNGSTCVPAAMCNDAISWFMCHSDRDCPQPLRCCGQTSFLGRCLKDCS